MKHIGAITPRVKYYILDWVDRNKKEFLMEYNNRSANDLNINELKDLFERITIGDLIEMDEVK